MWAQPPPPSPSPKRSAWVLLPLTTAPHTNGRACTLHLGAALPRLPGQRGKVRREERPCCAGCKIKAFLWVLSCVLHAAASKSLPGTKHAYKHLLQAPRMIQPWNQEDVKCAALHQICRWANCASAQLLPSRTRVMLDLEGPREALKQSGKLQAIQTPCVLHRSCAA